MFTVDDKRDIAEFIRASAHTVSMEVAAAEFLQTTAAYWTLCALELLEQVTDHDREEAFTLVMSSYREFTLPSGASAAGFGGAPGHDPHVHHTASALLVHRLCGRTMPPAAPIMAFIASLQSSSGSFRGFAGCDEEDSRYVYCALLCAALLGQNPVEHFNVDAAVAWLASCCNLDGGYGQVPGAESHAAQTWTALAALALVPGGRGKGVAQSKNTAAFIAARQTPSGGLCGRPEKRPDACYDWWAGAAAAILGVETLWDGKKVRRFARLCYEQSTHPCCGHRGVADRPRNPADVYHSFFGLTIFGLLGDEGWAQMDPVYAIPSKYVA